MKFGEEEVDGSWEGNTVGSVSNLTDRSADASAVFAVPQLLKALMIATENTDDRVMVKLDEDGLMLLRGEEAPKDMVLSPILDYDPEKYGEEEKEEDDFLSEL